MLLTILQNLTLAVLGLLILYGAYFVVLAAVGIFRRTAPAPRAQRKARIAVVVAARNEEAVIGHLTDSLLAQDYPRDRFDVIVAPNNCTDKTADVAREHGAELFFPEGVIRTKGDVLRQVVDKVILPREYDAMCVFDADNLVDGQYLQYINDALQTGANAVQGFRDSKNPRQSAMSGCYSICYWMLNRFYNRGRAALGLSSLISGSGFCLSRRMLEKLGGFCTTTMTEDYEITAQCVLAGESVRFSEEACFWDEQPLTFAQSWRQRRRWTTGSLQGLEKYGRALFEQTVLKRSTVCMDLLLTFLVPLIQLIGFGVTLLSLAVTAPTGLVIGKVVIRGLRYVLLTLLISIVGTVVSSAFVAVLTVLLERAPVGGMLRAIAMYWLFMLSWMILTLLSFVNRKTTWDPIAHTSAKTLAQMREP